MNPRFHPKIGYIHHFVTLWADRTPTPWPKGWAGKKPAGDALFSSGIEPWHDWNKVWFDDIVVATDYIGPVQGKPKGGKKVAAPGKSALLTPGLLLPPTGKVVFSENFDQGPGAFRGGESRDGALACPPKGVDCWRTFSVPVKDSTIVRFKLKPLADVGQVTVMIWSDTLKDNARYHIAGLKPGEWRSVEFRAIEARAGWAADGASLDGAVLNNIKIMFEGPPNARLLLDDFEVTE